MTVSRFSSQAGTRVKSRVLVHSSQCGTNAPIGLYLHTPCRFGAADGCVGRVPGGAQIGLLWRQLRRYAADGQQTLVKFLHPQRCRPEHACGHRQMQVGRISRVAQAQYVTVRGRTHDPATSLSRLLGLGMSQREPHAADGSANEKPEKRRRREPDHATHRKPAQVRKSARPSGTLRII